MTSNKIYLVVFLVILVSFHNASAQCACKYITPDSPSVEVAFLGKILSVSKEEQSNKFLVQISEIFKGLDQQEIVEVFENFNSCNDERLINKEYLFMAAKDKKTNRINIVPCSYSYRNNHLQKQFIEAFRSKKKSQDKDGVSVGRVSDVGADDGGNSQTPEDCFEIKHLDFFGLDKSEVSLPESEVDGLLKMDDYQPSHSSSFLVPMIIKELAVYHSCNKNEINIEHYKKLVNLYFKLRRGNPSSLTSDMPFDKALELIRQDFYDQIKDDELLLQMIYSMDDGPLTGEVARTFPKNGKPFFAATGFGDIRLVQSKERIYAGAFDKNGKPIWIRILKGTMPERYLKRMHPEKIELNEFEAASILTFFADGERLKIYVRPNGRFMFYTHSW